MMAGVASYRCLACNQSTTRMHGTRADHVSHKALAMTPSTLAPDPAKSLYHVENGVVVRADGGSGRMGALKPLGVSSPPGVPRVSVGIGQRASGRGSGGSGGGSVGRISKGRPGTAPTVC
jgi:hypothetical protein